MAPGEVNPEAASYVQRHYDAHAHSTTRRDRARGVLYELKKFHNAQKRDLINRYARGVDSLLDLGCGRGGDLQKWADAGIRYVRGVDISQCEIDEARRRLRGLRGPKKKYEFERVDLADAWESGETYDAVTAMFCMHYFFETESKLRNVLRIVSTHLTPGGTFFGCVPDGARVRDLGACRADHVTIEPRWEFDGHAFGRAYIFALDDTVTSNAHGTAGSLEYLVDMDVLIRIARDYDLGFVEATPFAPPVAYAGSTASRLFTTFAFRSLKPSA